MMDGDLSCRFAFTNNDVNGFATANYAVQGSSSAAGSVRGVMTGNTIHGVTTAHCLASTAFTRIFVADPPGLTGVFPAGSALPLLDNTGGGRGCYWEQNDLKMILGGNLDVVGAVALTGLGGTSYIDLVEQSADPAAPAANHLRIFAKDNGSGKTQLAVRFPTGATQIISTEP
jgi:hypothetical protein